MPIRLQSLELQGYKSFATRTDFEFADGVTAIVGPNGSGKSNISDSLRWVLGEQSYLLLRGKKTEDMIFNGSDSRPRAGMASVSIVFDNHDNWLPVDFSEVAITRRAYRDGRNDYLLNGQHVRLRELNELLAQSGLADRTYTILGQGMVDASLALRSEDRRRLFEEAAGIGLYRSRREEALRRLEDTRRNLERVLDILAELEPRLKSLERQARRAQEYRQVQQDLKGLLREYYGYHWQHAGKELNEARSAAATQQTRLDEARQRFQAFADTMADTRRRLAEQRSRLHDWNRQAAELHGQREALSRELAVLDERRRSMAENRSEAQNEIMLLAAERESWATDLSEAEAEAARLEAELVEAQSRERESREALSGLRNERAVAEKQLQDAREQVSQATINKAQISARIDELAARLQSHKTRLLTLAAGIATAESVAQSATASITGARATSAEAEDATRAAETGLQTARRRLETLEADRRTRLDERSAKAAEHSRVSAQQRVLEEAEQSLAGLAEGARALLEAARESRLSGAHSALAASLQVPEEFETALAAALGDHLDTVLLDGDQSLEEALAFLEQDSAGRAALLPLGWLTAGASLDRPADEACLGVASEIVHAPEETRPAINMLLGRTLIVRDRRSARRLLKQSNAQRVVTLRGEVFRADGLVLAGKENRSSILSRPREKRELQNSLTALELDLAAIDGSLEELSGGITQSRSNLAAAETLVAEASQRLQVARRAEQEASLRAGSGRTDLQRQRAEQQALQEETLHAEEDANRLKESLLRLEVDLVERQASARRASMALAELDAQEATDQVTFWSTRAQVSERALAEARKRCDELRQAGERLEVRTESLGRRMSELGEHLDDLSSVQSSRAAREAELVRSISELREQIDPAERELEAAERNESAMAGEEATAQRTLQALEHQNSQAQLELARKQEALEALQRRIEDDFGLVQFEYEESMEGAVPLPLGDLVETLPIVTELAPQLGETLAQKKAQLRRMGAINLEAHQEYEETLERFSTMSTQIEDLREAEADLREVIAELDEQTRAGFTRTFEAVAAHFKEIFVRLFGGGSARLVLTDPENLNETGIDIEARLPGKREQGLALLSGGERSLTAIALVFALLRVAPTPLCVLDEVDAMLDEANVGRFRDLLMELSGQTQFIVITHNRSTVQVADVIYGVTMGRDSVSQVISLKLDEVGEEMLEG